MYVIYLYMCMYIDIYIYICIYVLTLCFLQGLAHQMYDIKGSNKEQYAHLKKDRLKPCGALHH